MRLQTQSWVSSPLGRNSLLALFKNNAELNVNKYQQIEKGLEKKLNFKTCNKVFHSITTSKVKEKFKAIADVEEVNFQNIQETFTSWLFKHTTLLEALNTKFLFTNEALLLANISTYMDKWTSSDSKGETFTKVYNSFSYTEDIKYEARLLELPMQDKEFKLVILVPNEADVLNNLFKKLANEGLTAATACITPLFTATCKLSAPVIEFNSYLNKSQENTDNLTLTATEFGNVKINEAGVSIKVLTCFASNVKTEALKPSKSEQEHKPFYFAIIFKDLPIFTGFYESIKE